MENYYIFNLILNVLTALFIGTFIGMYFVQMRVQMSFRRFNEVKAKSGITASNMAREILKHANVNDVAVIYVNSLQLTDHFDPEKNTIELTTNIYNSSTVSALGIAAHEVGHAIQRKEKYGFYVFREKLTPVVEFGSKISIPVILIGLIIKLVIRSSPIGTWILLAGFAAMLLYSLFMLITLPVEINASKRALNMLGSTGILDENELLGAEEVLKAAQLTYVYAFYMSFFNAFRFALAKQKENKNDKDEKK